MPLTDTSIRAIKPAASPQKISDGGGLYLFVTPNGTKAWRLAYRYNGKQKSLSLGLYPVVTLGEARTRRERSKKLLTDGIDPSAQRKLDKIAAKVGKTRFVSWRKNCLKSIVSRPRASGLPNTSGK